ncbi:MAG: hypothetical protein K2R98_06505 [Gemmataceae bacterium]|nr:hypothetical protein [Gemmataceae bacterium]
MSYGVEFDEKAEIAFYSWNLPIDVIDEIERRFVEELSERPTKVLRDVGGSMQYVCRVPGHVGVFHVRYSMDEETLIIWNCFHFPLRS